MSAKEKIVRALASAPVSALARPLVAGFASIFMLHRLRRNPTERFAYSIDSLRAFVGSLRKSGARFVALPDLINRVRNGEAVEHCVTFTIDDGFADQAVLARELVRAGCPVTVFIISGLVDRQLWPWDDKIAWAVKNSACNELKLQISDQRYDLPLRTLEDRHHATETLRNFAKSRSQSALSSFIDEVARASKVEIPESAPNEHQPLDWNTIRELQTEGVTFGAHSVTHRIFSQLTDSESQYEIQHSIRRVREETGAESVLFAWPTGRIGDFSERDIQFLRESGVPAAFSTNNNYADFRTLRLDSSEMYQIKRFTMPHNLINTLQYGTWIERSKQVLRRKA